MNVLLFQYLTNSSSKVIQCLEKLTIRRIIVQVNIISLKLNFTYTEIRKYAYYYLANLEPKLQFIKSMASLIYNYTLFTGIIDVQVLGDI